MNEYTITQIHLLEQSVSSVVEQSMRLASMIDTEKDLLEDLQQTAIALRYLTQALEAAVGIRLLSAKKEQISQN